MQTRGKILVTGAAGHLGSHLATELDAEGYDIVGLDIVPAPASWPSRAPYLQTDLGTADGLQDAVAGTALIAHCASIHPWKPYTDEQYLDANIKGTWRLYAAAKAAGVSRIVLTSSIAAAGYHAVPVSAWPVTEDGQFPLGDLYSFTKHAQEDIARQHAFLGSVRTLAIRPPAFMPRPELETGFALTGTFAVVEDIVSAHMAAIRVLLGHQEPGFAPQGFEALNCTNRLPYTREDIAGLPADRNILHLVKKYWPDAVEWLEANGYRSPWLPAVYDVSKAKALLGWEPAFNFEQWFARHAASA
jgi:nucleoside-diphosphate-sugar epimerase